MIWITLYCVLIKELSAVAVDRTCKCNGINNVKDVLQREMFERKQSDNTTNIHLESIERRLSDIQDQIDIEKDWRERFEKDMLEKLKAVGELSEHGAPAEPDKPRGVQVNALNSSALSVEWRAPRKKRGCLLIRGYILYYCHSDGEGKPTELSKKVEVTNQAVIAGLLPSTWYHVSVAAYTEKAYGTRSWLLSARTSDGEVPSEPKLTVELTQVKSQIALVSWSRPESLNGQLLGFRLIWNKKEGPPSLPIDFDGTTMTWKTPVLDYGALYEFQLSAKNEIGNGPSAFAELRTPAIKVPSKPILKVVLAQKEQPSAFVSWSKPVSPNGKLLGYTLYWGQKKGQVYETTEFSDTTAPFWDSPILEYGAVYEFRLLAKNEMGNGPSAVVELQTPDKVELLITLAPRNMKVAKNRIVSFFCKASGIPNPQFHWERDGKPIGRYHKRYEVFVIINGTVLRIEPTKARDNTFFTCVAKADHIEARANATLTVYDRDGDEYQGYPEIVENPQLKSVERGQSATFSCSVRAENATSPYIIYWLKFGVPLDIDDPRIHVNSTGALTIHNSQDGDQGQYECVAENEVGVAYSLRAMLYVRERRIPPYFTTEPPDVIEVGPSGNVAIECEAAGAPMPVVFWRQGSTLLNQSNKPVFGRNVLNLTDMQNSNYYTCVASSNLGLLVVEKEVRVIVFTVEKLITLAPRNMKVAKNRIVSFFCKASGIPVMQFHWEREGKPIDQSSRRYQVFLMRNGTVLRIEPTKASDSTFFTCVAKTDHSKDRANATLTVYDGEAGEYQGYPEIVENPQLKGVEKGQNATFSCSARAVNATSPYILYWLKDGVPLDTDDPRIYVNSTGTLTIHKSKHEDQGAYECVAENEVGVAYSTRGMLYVRVRRIPPHFTIVPPAVIEVKPAGNVTIICEAIGVPVPVLFWRQGTTVLNKNDEPVYRRNVLYLTDVQNSNNYTCVAGSTSGIYEKEVQVRVTGGPD